MTVIPLLKVLRRSAIHLLPGLLVIGGCVSLHPSGGLLASQTRSATTVQQTQRSESDRINRPTSEPYKGDLSIFEDPGRDERLQINRVMDLLGIKEGSGVADIGAGSGWFTVRAARRVGDSGNVYAVEINPSYLKHIEGRARFEHLAN